MTNMHFHTSKDKADRGALLTEQNNANSKNIDKLTTSQIVGVFCNEDKIPQKAVYDAREQLTQAIDQISSKLDKDGRLFYIGCGTSGRLGVLDAAECPPTFCTPPELIQGIIAGGDSSLTKSSEGLEDKTDLSIYDLNQRNFSAKDVIIGISSGGTTPYVLSALEYSKKLGALTISITCVPKTQVYIDTDIDIRLLTGPEIIAGSTRLKAGTATKMALNIISSGVMIKLGKVYGNRMIDLSISNRKLFDRSIRILMDIINIDREKASNLIKISNGSLKISILIHFTGMDSASARKLLDQNNNNLTYSLEKLGIKK